MYLSTEQFTPRPLYPTIRPFAVETLLEQGSGELNEDVLLAADDLFGVFDGATSLDERKFDGGRTGGLLAAQLAAKTIREGQGSLAYLAAQANRRIRSAFLSENDPMAERHRLWSTSLAVIRPADDHMEYCQIGDAMILVVLEDGGFRLVTPELDIDRQTLHLWQEAEKSSTATIQDLLADQILRVRLQMNVSYGVLNGEPAATQFLRHGYHDLRGASDILLFTDGLFLPKENPLADEDWQGLVNLYRCGGLQAVRQHIRRLQFDDARCRKFPRFKQHDDIAAVAIRLNNERQPAMAFS